MTTEALPRSIPTDPAEQERLWLHGRDIETLTRAELLLVVRQLAVDLDSERKNHVATINLWAKFREAKQ